MSSVCAVSSPTIVSSEMLSARLGLVKHTYDKSHGWIHDFLFMWPKKVNFYDDGMFYQETHN